MADLDHPAVLVDLPVGLECLSLAPPDIEIHHGFAAEDSLPACVDTGHTSCGYRPGPQVEVGGGLRILGHVAMYAVLANDGRIDGRKFLSSGLVRGLTGKSRIPLPDFNMVVPMPFHLGYHESPVPGLLNGFGHVGLGGTLGWADPDSASSSGFVHNRLLTPLLFEWGL
jgi:CubicO group peptidase (beta-lactamase class C family)